VDGTLKSGVTAKDIILAVCAKIGIGGGTGSVFEYVGSAIRALTIEERMTVCNMSIEAGARAGLIAPDDTTYQYLNGRHFAPQGAAWDSAVARWRSLPTDEGATYDKSVSIDASSLEPMITFGTNPGMGIPISGAVPEPGSIADPIERESLKKALSYMALEAGKPLAGHPIDARVRRVAALACSLRGERRTTDFEVDAAVDRPRWAKPDIG